MKDFVLFYEVIEIATVEIIDKRLQAMFKNETKSFYDCRENSIFEKSR